MVDIQHVGIVSAGQMGSGISQCNHPIGPLALAALIGLDTVLAIMRVFNEGVGDPRYRPARAEGNGLRRAPGPKAPPASRRPT